MTTRGTAYCAKFPQRYSGIAWPVRKGITSNLRINVCSWGRQRIGSIYGPRASDLSPMYIGPITVTMPDGITYTITSIENLWQPQKIGPGEWDDDASAPIAGWEERRNAVWADPFAHRRVVKKDDSLNNDSLTSWICGRRLTYVEARPRVYIPAYVEFVQQTSAYKALDALLEEGYDVMLIGHDGLDYHARAEEEEMTTPKAALAAILADANARFGHELVLCGMLNGERVWEEWPGLEPAPAYWHIWAPPAADWDVAEDAHTKRMNLKRTRPKPAKIEPKAKRTSPWVK